MLKRAALLLLPLFLMSFSRLTPVELSCEHQQQPLLDITTPRLSWKNISEKEGDKQSAYRIRVVKHEGGKEVVVWDSGKVLSDSSLYIPYGGKTLVSSCDYSWQVKVGIATIGLRNGARGQNGTLASSPRKSGRLDG